MTGTVRGQTAEFVHVGWTVMVTGIDKSLANVKGRKLVKSFTSFIFNKWTWQGSY
ncbi:hypothetical protein ACT8ZR_04520 [Neobacillus sp. M.A.Huq-85]|nr:hypothetical protein QNK12_12440 [Neobacillus cucumis]